MNGQTSVLWASASPGKRPWADAYLTQYRRISGVGPGLRRLLKGIASILIVSLAACGGGGSAGPQTPVVPNPPAPSPPDEPDRQPRLVTPATGAEFAEYIRAGLTQWASTSENGAGNTSRDNVRLQAFLTTPALPGNARTDDSAVVNEAAQPVVSLGGDASAPAAPSARVSSGSFTETNTIVAGVDERDRVKYDGEHMYLLNWDRVQAFRMSADAAAVAVDTVIVDAFDAYGGAGLYLLPGESPLLAAVGGGNAFVWFDLIAEPWFWNTNTSVEVFDISDPGDIRVDSSFTVSGTLTDSRRIGDQMLLITRYTPAIDGLLPYTSDADEQAANKTLIDALDIDDLLPEITYRSGETENLVTVANCFLPGNVDSEDAIYLPTITTISLVNLRDPTDHKSICMADGVQGVHVTTDAVYLSGYNWQVEDDRYYESTIIHQFDLAESGPAYVGSGEVPGSFWGNPALLMGESGGALAVVTTSTKPDPDDPFEHHLTMLGGATEGELAILGQIPSDAAPASIGKPRERIFASRIAGDRAYIVTFEQVDPVYVIDLATASAPRILGELTIPGFSEYLHPLGNDRVLGVGRDATDDDGFARLAGVNVRLFDVSDPSAPGIISDVKIGQRGSFTDVAWDYLAFTLLQVADDEYRLALPVTSHGEHVPDAGVPDDWWWWAPWTRTGLHLFDVTPSGITEAGVIVASDHAVGRRWASGCCAWGSRSVIHDDAIHYLDGNQLITGDWTAPATRYTAFVPTVFDTPDTTCTEERRAGLHLYVVDSQTGNGVGCATAVVGEGEFSESLGEDQCNAWLEGVFERAGTYTVSVSATGYLDRVLEDVVIQADQCHVQSTYVHAFLDPAPEPTDG